jgi:hypothetical protein
MNYFRYDRQKFLEQLDAEITKYKKYAHNKGYKFCVTIKWHK